MRVNSRLSMPRENTPTLICGACVVPSGPGDGAGLDGGEAEAAVLVGRRSGRSRGTSWRRAAGRRRDARSGPRCRPARSRPARRAASCPRRRARGPRCGCACRARPASATPGAEYLARAEGARRQADVQERPDGLRWRALSHESWSVRRRCAAGRAARCRRRSRAPTRAWSSPGRSGRSCARAPLRRSPS